MQKHAPYYTVIFGLPGSTIFFHVISETAWFSGKKVIKHKIAFWFSLQLLSETFLILTITQRHITNFTQVFMQSARYFCHTVMKLDFSGDFRNIKFHENPSSGIPVVPCGRAGGWTDGHTVMKKLTVAFRNVTTATENVTRRIFCFYYLLTYLLTYLLHSAESFLRS